MQLFCQAVQCPPPFPAAHRQLLPHTHSFKRTRAHPIRLLKIPTYLPNTNFSIQPTAVEKECWKIHTGHRLFTAELRPMNGNADNSHFIKLCATKHGLILWLRIESSLILVHIFVLITLSPLGVKVIILHFCSNYTLKWKLPHHRKSIRKVKRSSWTELEIFTVLLNTELSQPPQNSGSQDSQITYFSTKASLWFTSQQLKTCT